MIALSDSLTLSGGGLGWGVNEAGQLTQLPGFGSRRDYLYISARLPRRDRRPVNGVVLTPNEYIYLGRGLGHCAW